MYSIYCTLTIGYSVSAFSVTKSAARLVLSDLLPTCVRPLFLWSEAVAFHLSMLSP